MVGRCVVGRISQLVTVGVIHICCPVRDGRQGGFASAVRNALTSWEW